MSSCRFCRATDGLPLVHYSVRHYAHPDCLLKAKGAAAFDLLHDWQILNFPALAARRAGLLSDLTTRCDRIQRGRAPVESEVATPQPIECIANRGNRYRVHRDQYDNFVRVEVRVTRAAHFDYWRKLWDTTGGNDPSTTACCAMRSARAILATATAKR